MAQLSGQTVAKLAFIAGVPRNQLVTCVAIAWAESGLRTDALGHNGPTSGCPNGSPDRGLWQINDCYHRDVSDACAFDASCNARAMLRISNNGTNWRPWSTFNSNAYHEYVPAAQIAVNAFLEGVGEVVTPTPTSGPAPVPQWLGAATAIEIQKGSGPIGATARLLQKIVDEVMDSKYGPGHRTGPIMGDIIK